MYPHHHIIKHPEPPPSYNIPHMRTRFPVPTRCPQCPQELEGAFMIAFDRGIDALEWSLMLQEVMMEVRGLASKIEA